MKSSIGFSGHYLCDKSMSGISFGAKLFQLPASESWGKCITCGILLMYCACCNRAKSHNNYGKLIDVRGNSSISLKSKVLTFQFTCWFCSVFSCCSLTHTHTYTFMWQWLSLNVAINMLHIDYPLPFCFARPFLEAAAPWNVSTASYTTFNV